MYELWRFQRYRICLEKLEIRIGIEKLNFFLVHLVGSIQTKLKLDNTPKSRKQTQNSETKIVRDEIHLLQIKSGRVK